MSLLRLGVLLGGISAVHGDSKFLSPPSLSSAELYTPTTSTKVGPQAFAINATLCRAVPANGCSVHDPASPLGDGDMKGKIAVLHGQGCSPETQLRKMQASGAAAVLWVSDRTEFWGSWGSSVEVVGPFARSHDASPREDLQIPFVEVNPADIDAALLLLDQGETVSMLLEPSFNLYIQEFDGFQWNFFFSGLFPTIAGINCALAGHRLWTYLRYTTGFHQRWLPKTVLALELFANFERVIYLSIDPMFSKGNTSFAFGMIAITFHQPFCFVTTMLVAAFWWSLKAKLTKSIATSWFQTHRNLLIFATANIFTVDLVLSGIRASYISMGVIGSVSGFMYSLTVLSISALFILSSGQALSLVTVQQAVSTRSHQPSSKEKQKVLENTLKFMSSGVALSLAGVGWFLVSLPGMWTPSGWSTAWIINWTSFVFTSLFQILMFRPATQAGSHSNTSRSSRPRATITRNSQLSPQHVTRVDTLKLCETPKSRLASRKLISDYDDTHDTGDDDQDRDVDHGQVPLEARV